jgi:hypothetical protein
MRFATRITLAGPLRSPAQMLAAQEIDDHSSVHDARTAATLGLAGAPIEAPTHFSQIDPLATLVWGQDWFERGCISCHFRTMVVEGEQVRATLTTQNGGAASVAASKADGTPVLTGTASVGPNYGETELDARRAAQAAPKELFIVDRLQVGMRVRDRVVTMLFDEANGPAYPFSLSEKLDKITEPHPWYTPEGSSSSPWGRPVLPMEMISVLAFKEGGVWPVRGPALGLFLDLEVRLLSGPLFVDQGYEVEREVVGLSESRRTESYWTSTTLIDADTQTPVAQVLLHSGVFKESFAEYPRERLGAAPDLP